MLTVPPLNGAHHSSQVPAASSSHKAWQPFPLPFRLAPPKNAFKIRNPMQFKPWEVLDDLDKMSAIGKAVKRQIRRILSYFKSLEYAPIAGEEVLERLCDLKKFGDEHMAEGVARLLQEAMHVDPEKTLVPLLNDPGYRKLLNQQCKKPDFNVIWQELLPTLSPKEIRILLEHLPPNAGHLQRDLLFQEKQTFPEEFERVHAKLLLTVETSDEAWSKIIANPSEVFQDPKAWEVLKERMMQAYYDPIVYPYSRDLTKILRDVQMDRKLFAQWVEKLRVNPYTLRFVEKFLTDQITVGALKEDSATIHFLFAQFGDQSSYLKKEICLRLIKRLCSETKMQELRSFLVCREVTIEVVQKAKIHIQENFDMPDLGEEKDPFISITPDANYLAVLEAALVAKQMLQLLMEKVHRRIVKLPARKK